MMNTFNKVLNIIIVAMMVCANVALVVLVIIDGTGHHMISILNCYLAIMLAGTIALLLTPEEDLYKGYNPEPDRSEEYEKIQRDLYDSGYDMSKSFDPYDIDPKDIPTDDELNTHEFITEL